VEGTSSRSRKRYFQCFPNKEISKSEMLDLVFAMRSFENTDEDSVEEWLLSDACELSFQHMTNMDIVNAAMKQKKEEGGEDDTEGGGQSSESVSHSSVEL
jgi:hypothetical protein